MPSRLNVYSIKCPPKNATDGEKLAYARMFRAAPVSSALFEGDFTLKISRRPGALPKRAARGKKR
jgi:hypothetical protein